jgi:hypothetical protein
VTFNRKSGFMTIYKLDGPEHDHKPDMSIYPLNRVVGDAYMTMPEDLRIVDIGRLVKDLDLQRDTSLSLSESHLHY